MAITAAEILAAETMMASSWPSLKVALSGRWVLGTADGLTGRANSLFFLDPNDDDNVDQRLDWMERTFRKVNLPPRVRLTPLAPIAVIEALKARGYIFQHPTLTLKRTTEDLSEASEPTGNIEIFETCEDLWFDTFVKGSPRYQAHQPTLKRMLSDMLDDTAFLLARKGPEPAATAMCVAHLGWANIQNVMTLSDYQRQGLSQQCITAALSWAKDKGAHHCWVAVEQDNQAAINLYRSLGFKNFYSYIYAALES